MNNGNIGSKTEMHPELNSLNNDLKVIDLAVLNRAKPYGYIEAGDALHRVHNEKLFNHLYNSFDEFCLNRYQFLAEQGFKLIRASDIAKLLKDKGFTTLPEFESHARNLSKLLTYNQHDLIADIWLEVTSSGKKITVRKIKNLVDRYSQSSGFISSGSTAPQKVVATPHVDNNPSYLNPLDLQRQIEKHEISPRCSTSYQLHNSTPILQDSSPLLVDSEDNYLVEKLNAQLTEEGRKNRELLDINLELVSNFSTGATHLTNIIESTKISITDKDLKIQELTNQIQRLQQILAEKDDALNQHMNYVNTIEEQRNLDLTNWNNALYHSTLRCNYLEKQLNNQRTERNINTIDIPYKNI